MDEYTELTHWILERHGEVYVAKDFNGFSGEPQPTVKEAFDSLHQRLAWRRRAVVEHIKRDTEKVYHTRRVGRPRLQRRQHS